MNRHHSTNNPSHCDPLKDEGFGGDILNVRQRKTLLVFFLTVATMVLEILFGYLSNSMALLADGWHMATHAGAMFITFLTYRWMKKEKWIRKFNAEKLNALGGFTNAILLILVSIFMIAESVQRFWSPVEIQYSEALLITALGLLVNLVSIFILGKGQHLHGKGEAHPDHNYKGAYLHVLSDAFTSIVALIALAFGKWWGWAGIDSLVGVLGSLVILRWGYQLIVASSWELLDGER